MKEPRSGRGVGLWGLAEALSRAAGAAVAPVTWTLEFLFRRDAPELSLQWEKVTPGWRRFWIVAGVVICGSSVLLAVYLWFATVGGVVAGYEGAPDIRVTLLIVAAVVGAPFVVWRTILAAQQTRINQQTHFTDLFTKAVELLGADKTEKTEAGERTVPNIEVRLGAIYALERIMKQSPDDYWPIVSTLCAYVRQNATMREEPTDGKGEPIPEAPEPPDHGRDENPSELSVRLAAVKARVAALKAWGEWLRKKATVRGAASAQRPDIRAALEAVANRDVRLRMKHEGVKAEGDPPLRSELTRDPRARTASARRSFVNAYSDELQTWVEATRRPNLAAMELQGAVLNGVDLRRADLRAARLEGVDLTDARLGGANLSLAKLEGAILIRAELEGAVLTGAHLNGADLFNARLDRANLRGAQLDGADLLGARLCGADLNNARLQGAVLSGAHLRHARLNGAWLIRSDLNQTHLRDANMYRARLNWVRAGRARFSASLLAGADFADCRDLTYEQLASAFGDAATRLPSYLNRERRRLIAEARWEEDELTDDIVLDRWAAWRRARGFV